MGETMNLLRLKKEYSLISQEDLVMRLSKTPLEIASFSYNISMPKKNEVLLTPHKEFGWYYNSFVPRICIECNERTTATFSPMKVVRGFYLVFCLLLLIGSGAVAGEAICNRVAPWPAVFPFLNIGVFSFLFFVIGFQIFARVAANALEKRIEESRDA